MSPADIRNLRLDTQGLTVPRFGHPVEVVRFYGAMQAQEFAPAKWSIGQRIAGCVDAEVQRVFDSGEILRTHVLRPTWHFVAAEDIRLLLTATAHRVHALNGTYYRKHELDGTVFVRAHSAIEPALEGGRHLTRTDLADHLTCAGIETDSMRLGLIMMHAELEGLICSGAMRGKQQTYALLAERAPSATVLSPDEALAELTRRYFTSHGPATAKDLARWASLTVADVKRGLEMTGSTLTSELIAGRTYWFAEPAGPVATRPSPTAHLLQGYDEYTIAYGESRDLYHPYFERVINRDSFLHSVIVDGVVAAAWKRTIRKSDLQIEIAPYRHVSDAEIDAIRCAAEAQGMYLGLTANVTVAAM